MNDSAVGMNVWNSLDQAYYKEPLRNEEGNCLYRSLGLDADRVTKPEVIPMSIHSRRTATISPFRGFLLEGYISNTLCLARAIRIFQWMDDTNQKPWN